MKRVLLSLALVLVAVLALMATSTPATSASATVQAAEAPAPVVTLDQLFEAVVIGGGCTADDCRVCNDNGLKCKPEAGECQCI